MQAILKGKHQKFCDWIKDVRIKQPSAGDKLNELEDGLQSLYIGYLQKVQELRVMIHEYEETQRAIKNEVKRSQRSTPVEFDMNNHVANTQVSGI